MKVLTVNMAVDIATGGGTAARTMQFSRALSDQGIDCAIVTTGASAAAPPRIPIASLPATLGRFRLPYAGFDRLRAAAEASDVVLLMNHWTPINLLAWRSAERLGRPYAVCPAGALAVAGRSALLKRAYNAAGGRRLVREADAHIAVTADEVPAFGDYGVPGARVSVVPNGMPELPDGSAARFRARHDVRTSRVCLFVGRLAPIKGPDLLLDAFARVAPELPDWTLVLAGPDDGMLPELQRTLDPRTAERTRFTGFLDEQGKADALAAASLVVVPSRREAMSIVVLEAAAAGRAVLITDQCGVPDVAEASGGWVVKATTEGLAGGLRAAAAASDLTERGRRWHDLAVERYAWPRVGRQLVQVLTGAIERHRARRGG